MILDEIVAHTRVRVATEKKAYPLVKLQAEVEALDIANEPAFPFEKNLALGDINFICEIKKASPSKGIIAKDFPYIEIAKEYERAGASAISVLTEPEYFKGSLEYLQEVSKVVKLPLLRKDFIIDEYQIYQAKKYGASAILLICSILSLEELKAFKALADSLNLSCLVEAHDEVEVEKALACGARIIGVNNRDLKTFTVDIKNSIRLRKLVPEEVIFVSESGITTAQDIQDLRDNNIQAVLIGETLMRSANKVEMLRELYGRVPKPLVKYCGLKRPSDVAAVNRIKPDYVGFVFAPSKRRVSIMEAKSLVDRLSPEIKAVGVFVAPDFEEVIEACKEVRLSAVQIHGDYSPIQLQALKEELAKKGLEHVKVWQGINVKDREDLCKIRESLADIVLVDSYTKGAMGGTGKVADWNLLKNLERPIFLAGGLNSSNIIRAYRGVKPMGIDVSSGIEKNECMKDETMMQELMELINIGTLSR